MDASQSPFHFRMHVAHQAAQQRLRDMYEARLKEQAADFEAQFAAKVRELGVLKAKVERLEEQGPKVRAGTHGLWRKG